MSTHLKSQQERSSTKGRRRLQSEPLIRFFSSRLQSGAGPQKGSIGSFFFPDFSRRSPKKEPRTSSVVSYRLFQTRPDQEKVKRRPAPLTRCFGTVRVLFVRGPPHHALGGAEAKIPELRGRNGRRFSDDSLLSCLFLSSAEVEPMEDHRVKRAANGGDLFTPCTSALLLATMMDIDVSIFEASSREKKGRKKWENAQLTVDEKFIGWWSLDSTRPINTGTEPCTPQSIQ